MRTDHILVAIDLHGSSTEVVQAAAALAAPLGAKVTLLTVVSAAAGVNPFGETGGKRNEQILDEDAYGDLEPYVALLQRDGIEVVKDLGHGDAKDAILAATTEGRMPLQGAPLEPIDLAVLAAWRDNGFPLE